MRVWIVSQCLKWEGEYTECVLSDEGLDRYLSTRPAFHKEPTDDGYTTFTTGETEWYDIRPWQLDKQG